MAWKKSHLVILAQEMAQTKCTFSNKDNCVLVLGKQNLRPACSYKGKLEIKFSSWKRCEI